MRLAKPSDKLRIVSILSIAFVANKSVLNLVGNRADNQGDRIKLLMAYAFEECMEFGRVYITEDRMACALVLFPEQERITLKSLRRHAKLILSVIGLGNLWNVIKREKQVSAIHRAEFGKQLRYYLYFIGVDISCQNSGLGKILLQDLLEESNNLNRQFLLETSTAKSKSFYHANALKEYAQLDVGYPLYFFRS